MLTLALDLKQRQKRGEATSLLVGKSLVLLFSKPSLRTHASFEVGMHQLGGHTSYFEDPGIVMGLREPFSDLGRVKHLVIVKQQIQVDQAWAKTLAGHAAEAGLE